MLVLKMQEIIGQYIASLFASCQSEILYWIPSRIPRPFFHPASLTFESKNASFAHFLVEMINDNIYLIEACGEHVQIVYIALCWYTNAGREPALGWRPREFAHPVPETFK